MLKQKVEVKSENPILLRVGDAAKLLSISAWKLRQLAYQREVVSVKVGSLLMFRPEDLQHFAERNRVL
jgi:excisionase family DNA binding protein